MPPPLSLAQRMTDSAIRSGQSDPMNPHSKGYAVVESRRGATSAPVSPRALWISHSSFRKYSGSGGQLLKQPMIPRNSEVSIACYHAREQRTASRQIEVGPARPG
jgi:hypothetical protein